MFIDVPRITFFSHVLLSQSEVENFVMYIVELVIKDIT